MTYLTDEQELRARAVKIKFEYTAVLSSGLVRAGWKPLTNDTIWHDGDLEDIIEYIKTGQKPERMQ